MFALYVLLTVTSIGPPEEVRFRGNYFYSLHECEAARDNADELWGKFKRQTGLIIKFRFYCE